MVRADITFANQADNFITLSVESDTFSSMANEQIVALAEALRKDAILGAGYEGSSGRVDNIYLIGLGRNIPVPPAE